MIRYKVKSKDCLLTVNVRFPSNKIPNKEELDYFSQKLLCGFLKPQILKNNLIEYTGPIGVSLYERLQKPISKYDFFFIVEQVVNATLNLQKKELRWDKVVWNLNHAFINEVTKELRLIYLPIENRTEDDNVNIFIDGIIYSAKPCDESDPNFVQKFVYFIKSLKGYYPEEIEAYIKRECPDAVNLIRRFKGDDEATGLLPKDYEATGLLTESKVTGYVSNDEQTGLLTESKVTGYVSNDEQTGLLTESKVTGYVSNDAPTGLLIENKAIGYIPDETEATVLLTETDAPEPLFSNDEQTGLLTNGFEMSDFASGHTENAGFPTLLRVLTNEKISVNKPVFRIGKEKSYVDYFVASNVAVSRSHADIITRGNKYYVKDLNSKNYTYVNDEMIPIQTEIEIKSGDRLRLGNEEFVFNI